MGQNPDFVTFCCKIGIFFVVFIKKHKGFLPNLTAICLTIQKMVVMIYT